MTLVSIFPFYMNINKLQQRLIQIFACFIGTKFLHELMYLGMEYAFKFPHSLSLENIKGNFYITNILQYKNLITTKFLFKNSIKKSMLNSKIKCFSLYKNFYILLNKINPWLNILDFIINTGVRSNKIQQQQIIGMRGFLSTNRGYSIKFPLLCNFERGLNLLEFIISSYGARKGLLDTSTQTSESGHLTRRLVEVVQDIIIKEKDCGTCVLLILRKYNNIKGFLILPKIKLLENKYCYRNINLTEFYIQAPIICYSGRTVCTKCSGFSFDTKMLRGESLGVISGESLGEPSTQLTLRTFHTGGVLNITTKKILYTLKLKSNNSLFLSNFKILTLLKYKKLSVIKTFTLINKFKYILNNTKFKTMYNSRNYFVCKISKTYLNLLIIYRFNIFSHKITQKFLNKCWGTVPYSILFKNLINFYSFNVFLKNTLHEWSLHVLSNNLVYFILNYIFTQQGGLILNQNKMLKICIIFNKNIIYW